MIENTPIAPTTYLIQSLLFYNTQHKKILSLEKSSTSKSTTCSLKSPLFNSYSFVSSKALKLKNQILKFLKMLHRACRSGDLNQIAQALNTNMSIINDKDSGVKIYIVRMDSLISCCDM